MTELDILAERIAFLEKEKAQYIIAYLKMKEEKEQLEKELAEKKDNKGDKK